jgi:hypothetical protein
VGNAAACASKRKSLLLVLAEVNAGLHSLEKPGNGLARGLASNSRADLFIAFQSSLALTLVRSNRAWRPIANDRG